MTPSELINPPGIKASAKVVCLDHAHRQHFPLQKPLTRSELHDFFDEIGARTGLDRVSLDRGALRPLLVGQQELKQFFDDIRSRMGRYAAHSAGGSSRLVGQQEVEQFFAAVDHRVTLAETRQRRIDKRQASGFNVFDMIEPDENKLSDILRMLLDPSGDHGQGDLFLRLLLKQLKLHTGPGQTTRAIVRREAPTYGILKWRRRMDVLVEAGVLVAIENKVDSLEQPDQVKDYLEHLRRCTAGRSGQNTLIYLTPDGRPPDSLTSAVLKRQMANGRLHCWSYPKQLRSWLESCRQECEAARICGFLGDFMNYIESTLEREAEIGLEEEDNGK